MASVSIYKNGILLGTGSSSGGSDSITSYSGTPPGPRLVRQPLTPDEMQEAWTNGDKTLSLD
jgi:hypothetical protein